MTRNNGRVADMGRSLARNLVSSMADRIVYNYTGDHADHGISLVKPLVDGRAFLVARGAGPNVGDVVIVKGSRGGVQRVARYQIEKIGHTADGWRAYCRPV